MIDAFRCRAVFATHHRLANFQLALQYRTDMTILSFTHYSIPLQPFMLRTITG